MLKLIIGVKGTGKTKTLIAMVNDALKTTNGSVVCIEKGTKLRYDIDYSCRLIDTDDYAVTDADTLYGFIAGMLASNHDITDLFVDSAYKIAKVDDAGFDRFVQSVDALAAKCNVNVVMTSSIPVEAATEIVKKYI